LTPPPL
jgi:hypothetical protein